MTKAPAPPPASNPPPRPPRRTPILRAAAFGAVHLAATMVAMLSHAHISMRDFDVPAPGPADAFIRCASATLRWPLITAAMHYSLPGPAPFGDAIIFLNSLLWAFVLWLLLHSLQARRHNRQHGAAPDDNNPSPAHPARL